MRIGDQPTEGPPSLPIGRVAAVLLLACATTGVVIPSLRPLVEEVFGLGATAAGFFVAVHVAGTIAGARLWPLLLRRSEAGGRLHLRRLLGGSLLASAVMSGAMALTPWFPLLFALRFGEGIAHVGAVMLLMGLGTRGNGEGRTRDAAMLGTCLVLGVAAGMGVGAALASSGPATAFLAAALLALAALALARPLGERTFAVAPRSPDLVPSPASRTPPMLVLAERLAIGALTVWVPFHLEPRTSGALLGTLMTASVLGMPLARMLARRLRPGRTTLLGVGTFAAALISGGEAQGLTAPGLSWAIAGGLGAGILFAGALMLVATQSDPALRTRGMGLVHAFGSVGFLLGSLVGTAAATANVGPGPVGAAALLFAAVPILARAAPTAASDSGGGARTSPVIQSSPVGRSGPT